MQDLTKIVRDYVREQVKHQVSLVDHDYVDREEAEELIVNFLDSELDSLVHERVSDYLYENLGDMISDKIKITIE